MPIYKNLASQKLAVYAYDTSAGSPKTGDAANITAQISKDGGASTATNDANPTELDATNQKGIYIFDLLQAETNADLIIVSTTSTTSNIVIEPVIIYTLPGQLKQSAETMIYGTVDDTGFTPTASAFETSDVTEATADHFKARVVFWKTGPLAGQITKITAYTLTGGRGHFTIETATDAPVDGNQFIIL